MCEAATKNSHTWVLLSALTFAELAGRTDAWQRGLKEFNVTKSMFLEGFREEGRIEGFKVGYRKAIIYLLECHLGEPIPADVLALLERVQDKTQLSALVEQAVRM